jgi:hypothetical protein
VVAQNGAGPDSLGSLHEILAPAAIRRVLEDHADRVGKGLGWAPSSATVAITLRLMARISGALTEAEMAEVARLCGMVKARPPRLTATVRERLAQFDEPAILRRFLKLATRCFESADWLLHQARQTRGGSDRKPARLHQVALALAILIAKPLRREDLAELNLASDFRRDSKGRIVGLCIPGSKTKGGRDEEASFELPLIRRLEKHLRLYRPLLCEDDSLPVPGPDQWPQVAIEHVVRAQASGAERGRGRVQLPSRQAFGGDAAVGERRAQHGRRAAPARPWPIEND